MDRTLRPNARYEFSLRRLSGISGRKRSGFGSQSTVSTRFTTEDRTVEEEIRTIEFIGGSEVDRFDDFFDPSAEGSAYHPLPGGVDDPDGEGVVIARRDESPSIFRTGWLRLRNPIPDLFLPADDPATPEVEGTVVREGAPGTSVEIVV